MKSLLGWIIVAVLVSLRLALALVGFFVVPFINKQTNPIWGNNLEPEAPSWYLPDKPDWLSTYLWLAFRNPTNNLRFILDEPPKPLYSGVWDVDNYVRGKKWKSATRLVGGLTPEFWYLRRLDDGYFELRVGWKHGSTPGFAPTIQVRKEGDP